MKKKLSALLLLLLPLSSMLMAESGNSEESSASPSRSVHIVYMERPLGGEEDTEAYHIRTLASVLGSEEAAKEALVYSYKTAASGFSAKLTPQQVEEISKQSGVLQVVPSQTLQLHGGPQVVTSQNLQLHRGPQGLQYIG